MSNKATSSLPTGTAITGTELFPGIQSGNSRRFTADQIIARAALKDNNLSDLPSPSAARTNLSVYSQAQVDAAIAAAVTGLLDLKGQTDCSANPNYPAASKGDVYIVSAGGKIGGASGKDVDVGDIYWAIADNAGGTEAAVGTSWIVTEHNIIGASGVTYASAAEIRAGDEAAKAIAPDQLIAAAAPQTLTDGATINWDADSGYNAKVTLGGNRTLAAMTNPKVGVTYMLEIIQDGTGSRTLTWDACYKFGLAGTPTLSTGASKRDFVSLYCYDAATPAFRASFSRDS